MNETKGWEECSVSKLNWIMQTSAVVYLIGWCRSVEAEIVLIEKWCRKCRIKNEQGVLIMR